MFEVEIESDARVGTWFRVDEPHPTLGLAAQKASTLADRYEARGHLRVTKYGVPVLVTQVVAE